ncbi:MAG: hypothetical protein V4739_08120 [Pseudomonadota bacterium]
MPYVQRSSGGDIDSLHRLPTPSAREFIDAQHPELRAFLGQPAAPQGEFDVLDADFVRVIEDVIDTLIVKNILNITDLPSEAQAKLMARKGFRERVSHSSLRLFDAPESRN